MRTLPGITAYRPLTWRVINGSKPVSIFTRRLYSSTGATKGRYEEAIEHLNSLQTPYSVITAQRAAGIRNDRFSRDAMVKDLKVLGYSLDDLDKLNIVHVAGTKGKGSTCSYVDSILNQFRLSKGVPNKIGLFTSPHLIEVRERIQINSAPISYEDFGKYFFEVWFKLEEASRPGTPYPKPSYFRYLTLMSYHVFLSEKIDVAIYEVGVGGEYDATNVVQKPCVTGITSVGIDHTFQLGNTIPDIAWQKAGIVKKDCPNFYMKQTTVAMNVIESRCVERGTSSCENVDVLPAIANGEIKVRPDADFQKLNASLAIRLAGTVVEKLYPKFSKPYTESWTEEPSIRKGLENMTLRGRCEVKQDPENGHIWWYLDGAHTKESIEVAVKWFAGEADKAGIDPIVGRVLVFNQQGDRDALALLEALQNSAKLHDLWFGSVYFCPTSEPNNNNAGSDNANLMLDEKHVAKKALQNAFEQKWQEMDFNGQACVEVASGPREVIKSVRKLTKMFGQHERLHVLVTGSIHLVGKMLSSIDDKSL